MTNFDIAKPGPLMAGKRGLIMGVANERSIAWGIARVLAGQGAKLAFTYQGDAFGRRAIPLAKSVGSEIIVNCDVVDLNSVDNVFAEIKNKWGGLDFVVHALAFSDRRELSGRYADTTRDNFVNTMVISCFSFTEVAKRAAALMNGNGSLLTLSFSGATRWVPSYNVMGWPRPRSSPQCAIWRPTSGRRAFASMHCRRPHAHAGGSGRRRRARHLQLSARSCAAAAHADAGRGRRIGALSAVRHVGRRDRRGALRRLRLQQRGDAEP
jgi:NAD(P)-dependent dehydrogenase (short-subunit alcohol dehydrogenase family)